MKRLCELVKIMENNRECVVLEVTGDRLDLIKLGCFNGDEKIFRLSKGANHNCTVWTNNGYYSWHWGIDGHTLVSDEMDKQGELIQDCITKDFGIYIGENKNLIDSTLYIMSLEDTKHITHKVKLMYWPNNPNDICCHLDGEYYSHFKGSTEAFNHFMCRGYTMSQENKYTAQTGFVVEEYKIER